MLDWVIVGGGPHGVHLAIRLIEQAGVPPDRLLIVDPSDRLLATWRRCTRNTGMRFLRSPQVHHLGIDPWDLQRFARGFDRPKKELFGAPYHRPAIDLFDAHCDHVIERHGLADRHLRDWVEGIDLHCDAVHVQLREGEPLHSQRVLLATGSAGQPRWPSWAQELRGRGAPIQHVFAPAFSLDPGDWPGEVAVVGGGISAVQVALRLAYERSSEPVHLVSRHPMREHTFDSDSGWIGPKNMRAFSLIADPNERRRRIDEARHRGSVTREVHKELRRVVRAGRIRLHQGEPTVTTFNDGLRLAVNGTTVDLDGLLLATGFEPRRPGGDMIDRLVAHHDLACADCGYPILDAHLRWHPRVFVSGPLAELVVGPVARNLIGARRAAERIVGAARAAR